MKTSDEIKNLVKEKYGSLAKGTSSCCDDVCCSEKKQKEVIAETAENVASCCGTSCCGGGTAGVADSYGNLEGYLPDADLGLGCGLPTEHAGIRKGDTVVDLGSGAGNDVFVARALVGGSGKVIGVDMTPEMVAKAEKNKQKLGYDNVEFRLGEIENLPVDNAAADVVISNCVLNLVPDKRKAFSETFRILKAGGHFCISDIVTEGQLPQRVKEAAELYAGCVGGALEKNEYLKVIEEAGFRNIQIRKEKRIDLPDEVVAEIVSPDVVQEYRASGAWVYSITVYGEKQ
ncbi:MAG TPA: arsenite methyltransferase [Chitinophagales bacterium]|nr:arsenite methyltransferase [Chitinophagales bacterium]